MTAMNEQPTLDASYNAEMPTLSAQGSGWGQSWSMDLGEWETEEHADGPHQGTAYVTDMDGNEITGDAPEES